MTQALQYALWLSGPLLQGAIGGIMWRRKLYREYPLFFTYTLSHLVRFAILFSLYRAGRMGAYAEAYAYLEALEAVLSFAVIYELYTTTFRAYEGIRELGWMVLRWATVVLAVVAVVSAAATPGRNFDSFFAGLFALERSINIVRGGLLFLLFLLHASLGLRWSVPRFGIAVGFALLSSIELVTFAVVTHFGPGSTTVLSLISSAAYTCAILTWLMAVLRPGTETRTAARPTGWDVEGWNRTLLELLQR
jgi:hypothetical protein